MSADLERDVRLLDLDPVLLTESCEFISFSALENYSSGADPENSERKKGAPLNPPKLFACPLKVDDPLILAVEIILRNCLVSVEGASVIVAISSNA